MRPGPMKSDRRRVLASVLVAAALLTACTVDPTGPESGPPDRANATTPPSQADGAQSDEAQTNATPTASATPSESATPTHPGAATPYPISVAALAAADLDGGGLRLGAVRERTGTFTSYDVTFASRGFGPRPLRISGVLNVPTGPGPHPAVVLAHGYIDPGAYVRGQGMTRERGFLAERGFVALHVDYRNHAESGDDPRIETAVRLGYSADVIAAVHALRGSADVDPDRIALFGRSMGSGVVLKALAAKPGLAAAGVGWGSVSSLEGENFDHFQRPDAPVADLRAAYAGRHGLPDDDPTFWRGISSRPHFDEITEPVLLAHGRSDEVCPPRWATATQRGLRAAGVESTLRWYDDAHAFGPAFVPAMNESVRFLRARMPVG